MKYVILYKEDDTFTRVWPVIFTDRLMHVSVALGVIAAHKTHEKVTLEVLTAGTCWLDDNTGEWRCTRGSTSLGIEVKHEDCPEDATILNMPEAMQGMIFK